MVRNRSFILGFVAVGVIAGAGSPAGAAGYISNRLFFQSERAKADRAHGLANPQGDAVTQSQSMLPRVARAGVPLKVHYYYSVTPDCASVGRTAVDVVEPPQGGRVSTGSAREFPTYPATNVRSACNARRVVATDLFYRPEAGFAGTDRFTVEVVFPNGIAKRETYVVSVR